MSNSSTHPANISSIKLALMGREMRTQTNNLKLLNGEPIAIIGMACRFPGGANSPQAFWQLMGKGVDAISEVPANRWDIDALYDPNPATPGKMTTRWGGFLDQVDEFDADFFGISPREATRMDPQQRLFLEVAHEALEAAGQVRDQLAGSQTGVFVASYHNDYAQLQYADLMQIDAYTSTGSAHSIVANRLSYLLNLQGPSITVDTACSSSLVAAHLACQSLRSGESNLALAGGVSLILSPEVTISLSNWGFMAVDGRCKTFDARANGFVRGEGCGVIVLKRLADAVMDGDNILAVIRGSAVNQDGRTNVLTAPNGLAQQSVIRQALDNAGIPAAQISYIEAHGTGTSLGDPIEVEALTEVLGKRAEDELCVLGSVKTNIGHLEAAAGVAGLIKVVLSLQHGAIPPHLHFQSLNPHISPDLPFVIPTQMYPWPAGPKPRFAGVSSFGFGGTNAHIIVEEAPQLPAPSAEPAPGRPYLLPLSAHSPEALRSLAGSYVDFFKTMAGDTADGTPVADICYTAGTRRTHYDYRLALVGHSGQEFSQKLEEFLQGNNSAKMTAGQRAGDRVKPVFVFSGQGPQWWAMGRELLAQEPVFRTVIEQCDELLRQLADWSLMAELTASEAESRLDQTEIAQPAIFALQVGLAALWRSWGITPGAVIGHSVGEIAAAHVAGVLSLEDAVRVVFHRGRLMQRATGLGKMAAVEISPAEAEGLVAPYKDRLAIAAINSPSSVVLSGEATALEAVLKVVQEQGVFNRMLPVNYAFHSPQMAPFQEELASVLQGLTPKRAAVPIISTVTGASGTSLDFDAGYWGRNIREAVRFAAAVEQLIQEGYSLFLEIGPHPVLNRSIEQCFDHNGQTGTSLASLRRQRPEQVTMLAALAGLYAQGCSLNWQALYPVRGRIVSLPAYPWQRKRYWFSPVRRTLSPYSARDAGLHPLLGRRLRSPALKDITFESQLSANWPPFLADHRIAGAVILPATAYLELVLAAAAASWGDGPYVLEELIIQKALLLPETGEQTVQIILTPAGPQAASFQLVSLAEADEAWQVHATGKVRAAPEAAPAGQELLPAVQARCSEEMAAGSFYQNLAQRSLDFGPGFQGVERVWRNSESGEVVAQIRLPETLTSEPGSYQLHPAIWDACLQPLTVVLPDEAGQSTYLPVSLESLAIYRKAQPPLWSFGQVRLNQGSNQETIVGDFCIYDEAEQVVAEVKGLHLRRTSREALRQIAQPSSYLDNWLYELRWQLKSPAENRPQPFERPGSWLIFADHDGAAAALAGLLQAQGENCLLVSPAETYGRIETGRWQVNPLCPADFQRLLDELMQEHAPAFQEAPWRGVVHLWSLDHSLAGMDTASLQTVQEQNCGSVLHLVQGLARLDEHSRPELWLVTRGAQAVGASETPVVAQASLWGLGSTINLEHPDLHCTLIDLDPAGEADPGRTLLDEIQGQDGENRIVWREGQRYVARLVRYSPPAIPAGQKEQAADAPMVRLEIPVRGALDNLTLQPAPRRRPGPGEVEIRVRATGLNFRDILNALGMYPGDPGPLGDECAGEIVAVGPEVKNLRPGDRVMGLAPGSFSTFVIAKAELMTPIPDRLSFEEAATIPIPYLTAYYALHHLAKMSAGDRVLIHAAAGGVGMAAVQLAQRAGAEILGTAGSPEKRAFLQSLGVQHVMDSRSLDFADEIMSCTDNQGVHIVLNSLTGDFIPKNLAVLHQGGRFLEIGKIGIWDKNQVAQARPDVSYFVIFLGELCQHQPDLIQSMLRDLSAALVDGSLRPLPSRLFPLEDVASAFRYMAQAKHIGKIVVTSTSQPAEGPVSPFAGVELGPIQAEAAYLVTGGLGGLGLVVARWLVAQGATRLVLAGRSEPSEAARQVLNELEQAGVQILAAQADVSVRSEVSRLLAEIEQTMPPLRGIIHAAGVVADGVLLEQEWSKFAQVMAPKVAGAWHLHEVSQKLPLDFFVLFSSAASVLGSAGQANYAAANAFMDSLAHYRQARGLPASSINWGPWAELGMTAALDSSQRRRFHNQGFQAIEPDQGMQVLARILHDAPAQVSVLPVDWPTFASSFAGELPPLFSEVTRRMAVETKLEQQSSAAPDILQRLNEAPPGKQQHLLLAHIREQAGKVLGLETGRPVDPGQPLRELGLDSLMAVELRNLLSHSVQASLPATLLFDYPTISALADYLAKEVLHLAGNGQPEAGDTQTDDRAAAMAELESLSDEEAEALLLAELTKKGR